MSELQVSQNVALFGNRVFTEKTHLDEIILEKGEPQSKMTGILVKTDLSRDIHKGRVPRKDDARGQRDVFTRQEYQRLSVISH